MDNLFWIGFVGAALALIFAYLQKCKVMKCSEAVLLYTSDAADE